MKRAVDTVHLQSGMFFIFHSSWKYNSIRVLSYFIDLCCWMLNPVFTVKRMIFIRYENKIAKIRNDKTNMCCFKWYTKMREKWDTKILIFTRDENLARFKFIVYLQSRICRWFFHISRRLRAYSIPFIIHDVQREKWSPHALHYK